MVGILHYGMGNIKSVYNALSFIGVEARVIDKPQDLDNISHLIIPGVGAFSQAMKNLERMNLVSSIKEKALANMPILGICLGMQLLATYGEEGELTSGLGIIPGRVIRFPFNNPRVPHVGWNNVIIKKDNPILSDEHGLDFYFVHSYHFIADNNEHAVASCSYGIDFTAVIGKDNVFGVQFHPEKSFKAGLSILGCFCQL